MSMHPLKSGRLPYEVECASRRVQFVACGPWNVSLRLPDDPNDRGKFEQELTLDRCSPQVLTYPACYGAWVLNHADVERIIGRLIAMGCTVHKWFPPEIEKLLSKDR